MADDDIPLIPPVPPALREASQLGKLIPFVGAGASRLAGCPTWSQFADGTLQFFVDSGKFSYAQVEQLKELHPRTKLSLAMGFQKKFSLNVDFRSLLQRRDWEDDINGRRLYSSLSKIGKTFVTTNYDEWLDKEIAPRARTIQDADKPLDAAIKQRFVVHRKDELTAANLNRDDAVIHIHGSVKDPSGMIVTTTDYLQHYANDRRAHADDAENPVLTFLDDLFSTKTVLFIGYGLEELEILEYVILKAGRLREEGRQPRHFILQGFFSHEKELMLHLQRYYLDFGLELLPFRKDERNWQQLIEVLDDFARNIPASSLAVAQELADMERMFDD